jgi:hypothetical protein
MIGTMRILLLKNILGGSEGQITPSRGQGQP